MLQNTEKNLAQKVGLHYGTDASPGIYRIPKGKGFIYKDSKGKVVKQKSYLNRIKSLVIPPAWKDVWISKDSLSHIQVTGRDARGRKQYKYHSDWNTASNNKKFNKLNIFGQRIASFRRKINQDLTKPALPKDKIIAATIKLMEETHIRVGNDAYAKENKSYGLTTIRNKHVKVKGSAIQFYFRGKSGVINTASLQDPRLSKIIRRCKDLPGEELFGYVDENGKAHDIRSDDINGYIRQHFGEEISAKDFRTWGASRYATEILLKMKDIKELSDTAWKKRQCEIIKNTARALMNTVAVCRKYYVHPAIFAAARNGSLYKKKPKKIRGLSQAEQTLLALI
jgi:DNA topoisomerase I